MLELPHCVGHVPAKIKGRKFAHALSCSASCAIFSLVGLCEQQMLCIVALGFSLIAALFFIVALGVCSVAMAWAEQQESEASSCRRGGRVVRIDLRPNSFPSLFVDQCHTCQGGSQRRGEGQVYKGCHYCI